MPISHTRVPLRRQPFRLQSCPLQKAIHCLLLKQDVDRHRLAGRGILSVLAPSYPYSVPAGAACHAQMPATSSGKTTYLLTPAVLPEDKESKAHFKRSPYIQKYLSRKATASTSSARTYAIHLAAFAFFGVSPLLLTSGQCRRLLLLLLFFS
jgi:hypothetical protein